jgi:hypothetical protein
MEKVIDNRDSFIVDKGLIAMFLKMSPEERLVSNENSVRTILELRNAYQQQKNRRRRLERNT